MGESETDTARMPFGISEQSQRKESGNGKPEFSKWRTEIGQRPRKAGVDLDCTPRRPPLARVDARIGRTKCDKKLGVSEIPISEGGFKKES